MAKPCDGEIKQDVLDAQCIDQGDVTTRNLCLRRYGLPQAPEKATETSTIEMLDVHDIDLNFSFALFLVPKHMSELDPAAATPFNFGSFGLTSNQCLSLFCSFWFPWLTIKTSFSKIVARSAMI